MTELSGPWRPGGGQVISCSPWVVNDACHSGLQHATVCVVPPELLLWHINQPQWNSLAWTPEWPQWATTVLFQPAPDMCAGNTSLLFEATEIEKLSVAILTDAVTKSQSFYLLYPLLFISVTTTLVRTIFIFRLDYFLQSPPKESSHHQFCAPGFYEFPFFIMYLGKLLTALISPETVFIPATKFPFGWNALS